MKSAHNQRNFKNKKYLKTIKKKKKIASIISKNYNFFFKNYFFLKNYQKF